MGKLTITVEVDEEQAYRFLTIAGRDTEGRWADETWLAENIIDLIEPRMWGHSRGLMLMAISEISQEEMYS